MVDPNSPEGQAILKQAGVSYGELIFYVSSNLVGNRVRSRLLLPPPGVVQTLTINLD
jgi:hypothetical protein